MSKKAPQFGETTVEFGKTIG